MFSQVEKLKSVGLDVPQVTDLIWRLKRLGCPVSGDALSPEAAAEALLPLLKV